MRTLPARTIQTATARDLPDVLMLLNEAASWLASQGIDQWETGFDEARITPMIQRGEVYLVREDARAVATVTLTSDAEPEFWTPQEQGEPALYIAKLATARRHAGQGLGALLLRWSIDLAARRGMAWARLDAWRTNPDLHAFYRRAGWTHLRTVELEHRRSGALFQHPAVAYPEARAAFAPGALRPAAGHG